MEIDYYGNNDWRDYCLAHYGIPGMKWGIRRFQPYSTTGPRKGGKTGKEIGLARRLARGIGEGVRKARVSYKKAALANKRRKALEKARRTKAEKEGIMRSGSAEKMLKRKELFSNEEIDSFITRANKEATLENLRKSQAALQAPAKPKEPRVGLIASMKEKKLQKEKDEIMKTGSIEKMLENKDKFSNAEIGEFIDRVNKEKNLRDLQKQIDDQKAAEIENSVKRVASYLGTANELMRQGLALKGNVDSVKDAFVAGKKKSILDSNDAKQVLENVNMFNENEIRSFVNKANLMKDINKLAGNDTTADEVEKAIIAGPEAFMKVKDKATSKQVEEASKRFSNIEAIRRKAGEDTDNTDKTDKSNNKPADSGNTKDGGGVLGEKWDTRSANSIGTENFPDEKPFTKNDMNDSLKSLISRTSGSEKKESANTTRFPESLDRSVGTKDYSNEKAFTKSDMNDSLKSLVSRTSGSEKKEPNNATRFPESIDRSVGTKDYSNEKAFTRSDMSNSLKSLIEKNSTATHLPKSLDRSVGTKDYADEKPFTRNDIGSSTQYLISRTANQKDSIDKGRDTFSKLMSAVKETSKSARSAASEQSSKAKAAGAKIADALNAAANGSRGYNDAAHLGQETARQLLSGNYSKMSMPASSSSSKPAPTSSSSTSAPSNGIIRSSKSTYSGDRSTNANMRQTVDQIINRDYSNMFETGKVSSGSSAPSRSSSSDANRRATESLNGLAKRAAELSAQTAKVDDGRDYVDELLRRTKL